MDKNACYKRDPVDPCLTGVNMLKPRHFVESHTTLLPVSHESDHRGAS